MEWLETVEKAYNSGLLQFLGTIAFGLWSIVVGWGVKVVKDSKREVVQELRNIRRDVYYLGNRTLKIETHLEGKDEFNPYRNGDREIL